MSKKHKNNKFIINYEIKRNKNQTKLDQTKQTSNNTNK